MKPRLLLVSPYSSSKSGGIGTWTKIVIDYTQKYCNCELCFLNTVFRFKSNLINNRYYRIAYGIIDSFFVLIKFIYKIIKFKPTVIHYTSSASYALFKDIFAVCIAKLFRIKFIIHWRFGRIPSLFTKQNFEWFLLKKAISLADHSIVLDKNSYYTLAEQGFNCISIIPNPISENISNRLQSYSPDKKQFKFGSIVFIGHIIESKGVVELVHACCLAENVTELVLIGPVSEKLKEKLIKLSLTKRSGNWLKWIGEIHNSQINLFHR